MKIRPLYTCRLGEKSKSTWNVRHLYPAVRTVMIASFILWCGSLMAAAPSPRNKARQRAMKIVRSTEPTGLEGAAGSAGVVAAFFPGALSQAEARGAHEMKEAEPPEHRIPLLADPQNLTAPLIPSGANEIDDASVIGISSLRRLSVAATSPLPVSSFPGISYTRWIPPDSVVAAGASHVMTAVNSDLAIFSKSGAKLYQGSADSWFKNVVPSIGTGSLSAFDPQLAYDHFANRWLMVYLATDQSTQSWVLLSVSAGSDPSGSWCNYALPGDTNGNTPSGTWSDFDGLGFDSQAVYLTTNQFQYNTEPSKRAYSKVRIINKAALYGGCSASPPWYDFWDLRDPASGVAAHVLRPVVAFGAPGVEFMVSSSPYLSGTYWTLWTISNPGGATPSVTGINVPVAGYSAAPDADQLGGTVGTSNCAAPCYIDTGDSRLLNAVYRNGSVWAAQTVAGGASNQYSRVRYVRIAVGRASVLEDSSLGADGCWYYHPAVAVDGSDNFVMTFSRSCTSDYAGIRYTVRTTSDTEIESSASLKAGEANYLKTGSGTQGVNRWGDYSGAAVDPSDASKIWIVGEYAASPANTWGTYVGQITAGTGCQAPSAPIASNNGPLNANQTLYLTASFVAGATYSWVGPNGFTSSQQNPVIVKATEAAAGTYSVTAAVGGCSSAAASTQVAIGDCFRCPRVVPYH